MPLTPLVEGVESLHEQGFRGTPPPVDSGLQSRQPTQRQTTGGGHCDVDQRAPGVGVREGGQHFGDELRELAIQVPTEVFDRLPQFEIGASGGPGSAAVWNAGPVWMSHIRSSSVCMRRRSSR